MVDGSDNFISDVRVLEQNKICWAIGWTLNEALNNAYKKEHNTIQITNDGPMHRLNYRHYEKLRNGEFTKIHFLIIHHVCKLN